MNQITTIITTSPISSHPDTAMIKKVYEGVRKHLPSAAVLILFDGVRQEQKCYEQIYEEYKRSIRSKNWLNTTFQEFSEFTHQAGMIRSALSQNLVKTPLLLWIEHDFLLNDEIIDWDGVVQTLLDREVDCIRFCHDEDLRYISREHQQEQFRNVTGQKMEPFVSQSGVPLMPVIAMDTLPHIARADFYEYLVQFYKEGKIHVDCPQIQEVIENSYPRYKVAMYTPEGNMKRFTNLWGRGDEPKYEMTF